MPATKTHPPRTKKKKKKKKKKNKNKKKKKKTGILHFARLPITYVLTWLPETTL